MTEREGAVRAETGISVEFADAARPALTAGEYEVEVNQAIAGDIGDPERHEYGLVQTVRVTGPHFGLGPQDVVAVDPPAGSAADWSGRLPSVVFSRRTLPWVIGMPAGAPWCAILLLKPEELDAGDPEAAVSPTGTRQIPLGDYLDPPPGVRGPSFTPRQVAEFRREHAPDFTVPTIDVPAAVFSRIAPSLIESGLLAHTRTVRDDTTARLVELDTGEYATIVGNRIVARGDPGVYIAHLVSIEGFEEALPPTVLAPEGRVRLLSLTGWTFTSRAVGEGFADVMQRLDTGPLKLPVALGEDDPSGPAELVRKAIALGYTAADYRTLLGERTVAWYRGPLLPVVMKPDRQPPFGNSDAALVYDPRTGIFDVSFAAAWNVGRLLTLAERDVAGAMAAWVRRARRELVRVLARDRLARAYPLLVPTPADEAASAAAAARTLAGRELTPDPPARGAGPRSTRGGAWGAPIDPSGLLDHLGRLPGLVAPGDPDLLEGPGTPTAALLAAVRARGTPGSPPDSARPPTPVPEPPRDPRPRRAQVGSLPLELEGLVSDGPGAALAVRDEPPPPEVLAWLDRLALLRGVPFPLLVADTRALPPESIRFAHLDANWISALLDGALSVAAVDAPGHAVLDVLRPAVKAAVTAASDDGQGPVFSGFLLRSTAVADYPGLDVRGYADRAGLSPLALRRVERLSPTVLLALFQGRVGRVELATPAQGSGFGVLFSARHPSGELYLRGLGGAFLPGRQIPGAFVQVPFRADRAPTAGVLDVAALHAAALRSLTERYAPNPVPSFGTGAFGLQLVLGGGVQVFDNLDAPVEPVGPAAADRDRR